jgi:hypothetical protein
MTFGEFMQAAASWLGLSEIAQLERNEYRLVFDETFEVRFLSEESGSMVVYSLLATLPEDSEQRVNLLKRLLKGNLDAQRLKARSVLSLHPETYRICLFQKVDHGSLNTKQFIEIIETYLNHLQYWNDCIGGGQSEPRFSPFFVFP